MLLLFGMTYEAMKCTQRRENRWWTSEVVLLDGRKATSGVSSGDPGRLQISHVPIGALFRLCAGVFIQYTKMKAIKKKLKKTRGLYIASII